MTSVLIPRDAAIKICTSCTQPDCTDELDNPCSALMTEVLRVNGQNRGASEAELIDKLQTVTYPCFVSDIVAAGLTRNQVHSYIRRGILKSGSKHRRGRNTIIVLGVNEIL